VPICQGQPRRSPETLTNPAHPPARNADPVYHRQIKRVGHHSRRFLIQTTKSCGPVLWQAVPDAGNAPAKPSVTCLQGATLAVRCRNACG